MSPSHEARHRAAVAFTALALAGGVLPAGCGSSRTSYEIAGTKLVSPVRMTESEMYMDGGSIVIGFRDRAGRKLTVVSYTPLVQVFPQADSERRMQEVCHFYAGGYPTSAFARMLEPGSADELELSRLVRDCIAHAESTGVRLVEHKRGDAGSSAEWMEHETRCAREFQQRLDEEIDSANPRGPAPPTSRPAQGARP